jgi:hypothetical protein
MRLLLTFGGVMLLCASAVSAAGTLIGPAHVETLSEPAGLLVLGAGFVLLAHPVRGKKREL